MVGASSATVIEGKTPAGGSKTPGVGSKLSAEVAGALEDPKRRLGGYVLLSELGRGGMGIVHRAYDTRLRRLVAIKMILDPTIAGSEALERFQREASAAARVHHPGIVSVYETGESDGRPYIVMELIQGQSLEALLRRENPGARSIAEIVRAVALALAHAHAQGVIHRDVKPENVLVDGERRARLMDFGLAREVGGSGALTVSGQILGTPAYMAPEQARGDPKAHGPLSDVYSLGAVLYRALVGRRPFEGASMESVLQKVLFEEPVPPRAIDPRIHRDLETIALRCLAKEPARRYGSAFEVAEELRRFLDGESIVARPPGHLERLWVWARRNHRLAVSLGVLAVATSLLGAIGVSRLLERRENRRTIEAALASSLVAKADYQRSLDALVGRPGPATVAVVAGELDRITDELRAIERELYLGANDPVPGQTGDPIAGLDLAVRRALTTDPTRRSSRPTWPPSRAPRSGSVTARHGARGSGHPPAR
jgi:hypothetical protein